MKIKSVLFLSLLLLFTLFFGISCGNEEEKPTDTTVQTEEAKDPPTAPQTTAAPSMTEAAGPETTVPPETTLPPETTSPPETEAPGPEETLPGVYIAEVSLSWMEGTSSERKLELMNENQGSTEEQFTKPDQYLEYMETVYNDFRITLTLKDDHTAVVSAYGEDTGGLVWSYAKNTVTLKEQGKKETLSKIKVRKDGTLSAEMDHLEFCFTVFLILKRSEQTVSD